MLKRFPTTLLVAAGVTLAVSAVASRGEAQRLGARVFLTQTKIPDGLNEAGMLRFVRSHNARKLKETTGVPLEERKWIAELVTSFNRPPGDLEFHVLFYDIHDGNRQFLEDMSLFVNDRRQKTFVNRIKLERPRFKPNRRMELVVVVQRMEVARLRFETTGEQPRRSGQVDFSEEETR